MSTSASNLIGKRCAPCEGGVPALVPDEVKKLLGQLPKWQLTGDRKRIRREWHVKDFVTALDFFNRIGKLAEETFPVLATPASVFDPTLPAMFLEEWLWLTLVPVVEVVALEGDGGEVGAVEPFDRVKLAPFVAGVRRQPEHRPDAEQIQPEQSPAYEIGDLIGGPRGAAHSDPTRDEGYQASGQAQ